MQSLQVVGMMSKYRRTSPVSQPTECGLAPLGPPNIERFEDKHFNQKNLSSFEFYIPENEVNFGFHPNTPFLTSSEDRNPRFESWDGSSLDQESLPARGGGGRT